ncbi:MAG: DNA methyltransferase [Bacteroidales bacterium]
MNNINQNITFGEHLRRLRETAGFSLKDVSANISIDSSLLAKIERNERLPTRQQIRNIASFFIIDEKKLLAEFLSDQFAYRIIEEEVDIETLKVAESKVKYYTTNKKEFSYELNGNPKQLQDINSIVNKVIQGDCLEVVQIIPDKSIDMILCDLPYGTTQNKWDSVINLEELWAEYERIIKDDGVIALTAQGVFTAKLICSNEKLFKYKIVWIKSKPTNFLNAKKQPLRKHEDVCIFYKKQPTYNPQMTDGEPYDKGVRKDQNTGSYGDFKPKHVKSNGKRYPNDVIFYDDVPVDDYIYIKTAESEGPVVHPTQKPVELGRYLIKTYTKPGDIVLDNACGSGSFLVSALLENRQFIGIEKNENALLHKVDIVDYVEISINRIKEALKRKEIEDATLKLFQEPIAEYHKVLYKETKLIADYQYYGENKL